MSSPAAATPAPAKEEVVDVLEVRQPHGLTITSPQKDAPLSPCGAAPVTSQEDDEFEEFEQQEWTTAAQDVEDAALWQDGWEDDEDDDNFTAQLRTELAATESSMPPPTTLAGLLPTGAPMQQ